MNMKRLILAGCSIMVFSAGTALAGHRPPPQRRINAQDAQRQMQGQPTAAQQAEGARQGGQLTAQETQREMHAQPSVAEQPKGTTGLGDDEGC